MKKFVLLIAMCFAMLGGVYGTTFNLEPGHCVLDSYSNNTYCGEWKTLNINQTINFGDEWHNSDLNVTLRPPSTPKINENLTLSFGEYKNYYDYNLYVECENDVVKNYTLGVNETVNDDLRKIHIECGKDLIAVQNASKDLNPGEGWYNIRCLPLLKPINGTIILDANETFNKTWTFETDGGNCTVDINPTSMFWKKINTMGDWRDCNSQLYTCQVKLGDTENKNDTFMTMIIIIIFVAVIFAILWFKDIRGGGQWIKPFSKKTDMKDAIRKNEEKHYPRESHLSYFKKRYGG